MPLVNVMVNGKAYTLGCGDGEEPRLKDLAVLVDAKVREAQSMVGTQASDIKLLLTAALLLADEQNEAPEKLGDSANSADSIRQERDRLNERAEAGESHAADLLEAAAARIEAMAGALA